VHEPLVTRERFDQAAALSGTLRASRASHAPNPHPATKTSYLLRSFLWCAICGRRMWGKTHPAGHVYYICEKDRRQHRDAPWFEEHPTGVRLRADRIEPLVHDFFATHLPATNRTASPATASSASPIDTAAQAAHAARQQIAALQHRQDRLIEELEVLGETHHDPAHVNTLRANIYRRFTELGQQIGARNAELAALGGSSQGTNAECTARGAGTTTLADAPLEAQRAVFDAHHLTVRYDHNARSATLTATINGNVLIEEHTIEGTRRHNIKREPA
jgi:Recombinase zinc beta ribbon domain